MGRRALIVIVACVLAVLLGIGAWLFLRPEVITARLPTAEGLHAGSPVKAMDVHAGDVSEVRLGENAMLVEVELDIDVPLRSDACARLVVVREDESYLEIEIGFRDAPFERETIPPCPLARRESFVSGFAAGVIQQIEEATRQIEALGAGPTVRGRLEEGDRRVGETLVDTLTFEWVTGQSITVELRSAELQPRLIVRSPSGWQHVSGPSSGSRVEIDVEESGTWQVEVTSAVANQVGAYEVFVN